VVFGLGGTIAMAADVGEGVVPTLSAAQLVDVVPGLSATGVDIDVVDFRQVPSASLGFADIAALADAVRDALAGGADGVVITQGTDTLEETAYLLDLSHNGPQPVVVTGAMRNPTLAGADGPANVLAAVQVAADPSARGLGCLVVFADEIHAARRVHKSHTSSIATFRSPDGGPLGYVEEGQPRLLNRLDHRTVLPSGGGAERSVRVGLVTLSFGDDGVLLDGLADRVDGLVVAAFGGGHLPADLVAPVASLAETMPVVLASRTGSGAMLASTYGFPGSERDVLRRGLVSAGHLDPFKARLLLHRLLSVGADAATVSTAFGVAGGYREPAAWPWPIAAVGPAH
jgi:L-asparaginase